MRTDRTHLCGYCALRFAPAACCPKCGTERVYDLTDSRERRNGLRLLRRHYRSRPERWLTIGGTIAFLLGAPVAGLLTGLVTSSGGLGVAVLIASLLGCGLVIIFLGQLLARWRVASRALRIAVQAPPAPAPGAPRETFTGRVKLVEPVRAPLSDQPCAAYRVSGSGPVGPIDEAAAGLFDLLLDDQGGGAVRVDAAVATIELPVQAPAPVITPRRLRATRSALARLARERAFCPQLGAVRLAEARLDEGAWAEVTGTVGHQAAPQGYRTGRQRVLREQPGSPLLVGTPAAQAGPPVPPSAGTPHPAGR